MKINLLRPCALGVTLCLGTAALAPVAQAASKSKNRATRLEIWPGQRVLVVLPLLVSDDFLAAGNSGDRPSTMTSAGPPVMSPAPDQAMPPATASAATGGTATDTTAAADTTATPGAMATPNAMAPAMDSSMATGGSNALAKALGPLLAPQLSSALSATGKFSITRPYKFDPLLNRAVNEKSLDATAASNYIEGPSLSTARAVLPQLNLEQPGMIAQVVIQSLRVGGTAAAPTVQLAVRGDLYQADSPEPFRSINVTSRPFGGKTPEDRLAFVEPPVEFELPMPSTPSAGMMTGTNPGGVMMPPMGELPAQNPGGDAGPATVTPSVPMPMNPTTTPLTPNGTMGAPIAPQLPSAVPPLGVNVPEAN